MPGEKVYGQRGKKIRISEEGGLAEHLACRELPVSGKQRQFRVAEPAQGRGEIVPLPDI